jgi:hypothetical protein
MLQELSSLMPHQVGEFALWMVMVGLALGGGLWLAGACFSRSIITLSLVAAGSFVGKWLPGWMGWSIDPMATAVGGAIALGISGYLLHQYWVGIGLGMVLAAWTAMLTWKDIGHSLNWREMEGWSSARLALSFAVWGAGLTGIAATWLWPKVGQSLFYSITGLTLALAMALAVAQMGRGNWLGWVPAENWAQYASMAALVLVGAVVQWRLGSGSSRSSRSGEPEAEG